MPHQYAAGSASVTAPQMVMGTAQYLAPERTTGGPGSPASDLYSLGIVMYECLVGRPPFDGITAEVMGCHLYRPMPPLPAGLPPAISELFDRLTVKDPAARLADATELSAIARRLRAALAAAPSQVPSESAQPAGPTPRPARKRHPRLPAVAAAAVLAGACGLLASGVLGVPAAGGHAPSAGTTLGSQGTPSRGAAGAPANQGGDRTPGPSPSPDRSARPTRKANPGRSLSASRDASPTPRTSGTTAATTSPTGTGSPSATPTSGSTGSGSVPLPLPSLPGIGVSLSL